MKEVMNTAYLSAPHCPYLKEICNAEGQNLQCIVYFANNHKNDKNA